MNYNNLTVVISVVVLFLFILLAYKTYRDTKQKSGKWGLRISPIKSWIKLVKGRKITLAEIVPETNCPCCGELLPKIRAPKNFKQALWGGWSCNHCGAELDKWGRLTKR